MALRSSRASRAVVAAILGAAAYDSAFVNLPASSRGAATQMQGYRLDWMIEGYKPDGADGLQTQDGYFVGERGFEKSQAAQGLRYRMRPTPLEYKEGKEVNGLLQQFGPVKIKFGEAFGGTANNGALRDLKRKLFKEGITDPKKVAENEYWLARYGCKRWSAPYVDQSQGLAKTFLRGVGAWSGVDPLKEERGVTWFEADYGKPWLQKYVGTKIAGYVTQAQVEKEYATGKLLKAAPKK